MSTKKQDYSTMVGMPIPPDLQGHYLKETLGVTDEELSLMDKEMKKDKIEREKRNKIQS